MIYVRLNIDDFKIIMRDLGAILFVFGYILLLPLGAAYAFGEVTYYFAFIYPAVVSIWIGLLFKKIFRSAGETMLKHAMINAGLAWLVISFIGSMPYVYYGINFLDSYFESMAGFTTTGMTLMQDVEAVPKCILFWRSITQWIGGVGVIMLFLVVLLNSRAVITRFYFAEARSDRIKPAISTTVKYIWKIYMFFTFAGILLYLTAGMPLFDSINHSLTILSTGGYSIKNMSIAAYNSVPIEMVTVLLMLIGGLSFVVHYKVLTGNKRELVTDPETRLYFAIFIIATVLIAVNLVGKGESIADAFRYSSFQVVAIGTTTGYSTAAINDFPNFAKSILLFLMFVGGCVGSTGGGFKMFRLLLLIKVGYNEVMKSILPERAVVNIKLRDKVLENDVVVRLTGFFFLYIFTVFVAVLALTLFGYTPLSAISMIFSAMGNVGPVLLSTQDWFSLVNETKIILIGVMWIGRLEIFPALALISSLLIVSRREQTST
ncbi:MAG: TrkH family potassium uptake protein [Candidatus Hydrothermarchaeaceae archaeon]